MNKWHTWYKVLVGIWSIPIIFFFLIGIFSFIKDPGSDNGPYAITYCFLWAFGLALFHFIAYEGIYLHYYKKQQKQNIINEINALTLLKEQGIVSQDEYSSKVDVLKNELLGL